MKSGVSDPFKDDPPDEQTDQPEEDNPDSMTDSTAESVTLKSTDGRAKDKERELEELVGEDVYRLDAREAIYLSGMKNLDDAADILREWGYDL